MFKELSITVEEEPLQIFMQDGFLHPRCVIHTPHQHQHTEVFIMSHGTATLHVSNRYATLKAGDMAVIPPRTFHNICQTDADALRIPFHISKTLKDFHLLSLSVDVICLLEKEIRSYAQTGKSHRLGSCLALVCCELPGCPERSLTQSEDREFVIHDFLSSAYDQDISLKDVADLLGLSPKQTSRIITEQTGQPFRRELTRRRLAAAKYLMENTDMKLEDIAKEVGFDSYSGFWKAFSKTKEPLKK